MRAATSSLLFLVSLFFFSCSSSRKLAPTATINSLHFMGEYDIPYNLEYEHTIVGGLSGIDYDKKNNCYYMICDDRSDKNPARYYTARIHITDKGIDSVAFTGVTTLLNASQKPYPNNKVDARHVPDPEALRYDPVRQRMTWSSEGERIVRATDTILANPSINSIDYNGRFVDSFPIPSNLEMHVFEKGPRQNGVLEGMSYADNYKTLYVSVEEPLYEDGPRADLQKNGAFIRILKFDTRTRSNTAQYAYELDPIAAPANPATGFKINGVPDILYIGNNKLLVLERSFSTGILACTIKVFEVDMGNGSDVTGKTLAGNQNFTPLSKKLLLNMNSLGRYIDNVEGMTLGPKLSNGHQTILFVADNNFNPAEKAQLLLFEIE